MEKYTNFLYQIHTKIHFLNDIIAKKIFNNLIKLSKWC